MLKQLIIQKKLTTHRNSLEETITQVEDLDKRNQDLEGSVDEAETDEEITTLEQEATKIESDRTDLLLVKSKLEADIQALESELEELNSKEPVKEDNNRNGGVENMETREMINAYVKSKGELRAGFTSIDGGALIPDELLAPQKALEDVIDLSKYAKVIKVNSGAGKYPFIKKSGTTMNTVAELVANPELSKPTITEVTYEIDTYRGYIPISTEVIDDADYDVTGLIAEEIRDQELNTKNSAIVGILKLATPKAVTGIDGLKAVYNVDLKKVYNTQAILSASLYNELDTTKDEAGRYMMQDDITVASGKRLFGREVVVMDDTVIGTLAGDLVGFIGDVKQFVTLFDRMKTSVKWIDNDVYGELLAGFVRFDVKGTDADAGFYVTYTPVAPAV